MHVDKASDIIIIIISV